MFQTGGLSRAHWSNATPILTIFKEAFTSAGLAYANPQSFRKTLAQLRERLCRDALMSFKFTGGGRSVSGDAGFCDPRCVRRGRVR